MKILIAEDNPISNQLLVHTLTQWGYEVINTTNGKQAWEVCQQLNAPRLVLLDWDMPELSGLEVCQKIRQELSDTYIYVILLTGKNDQEDVVEGLSAGADDYVTKPFNHQELQIRIKAGERIMLQQEQLQIMLKRLQKNERLHQNFVAALTHDLRTPLAAEKRAFEIIQKMNQNEKLDPLLSSLGKNNQDLLQMVNQLLETFHYQEKQVDLQLEPVSLKELGEQVQLITLPLFEAKQMIFKNQLLESSLTLWGDRDQLKRVLVNLISNAVTSGTAQNWVEVSAEKTGDFVTLQIQDNGPGITPEVLPHLFERYYLPPGGLKTGSGLGLSICKSIIEQQGGRIQVNSTLKEGTCFTLTLSIEPPELSQLNERLLNIFIVDDQELARIGLKLALEATENIQILGLAENGQEALQKVEEQQPDVVLMDLLMPEMDGITATQKIKALYPNVKIVVLTSQNRETEIEAALASGADAYCMKDIKTNTLVKVMQAVASGRTWLDPQVAALLLEKMSLTSPDSALLTEPEKQVLYLIAGGKTNREVGHVLHENDEKINARVVSVLQKLSQNPQVSSAAMAIQKKSSRLNC